MAKNSIFNQPFPGMDPGFEQFCAISEKDFMEMIRAVCPGEPNAVRSENETPGKSRSAGHASAA